MLNKKIFLTILVGFLICVSSIKASEAEDEEIPEELRKEIEKIEDTIKVVQEEMDSVNNTHLEDPEAAVKEAAQKAKTLEVLQKTMFYLNKTCTVITWGSRMFMKKLVGDELMKFLAPCKHDVKVLRTPLVDAVWGCGGKHIYNDETIIQKPLNTTRELVKNLLKIPEKFEKCSKGKISKYVKFYCPVKYAIKIGYWVTQTITSLISDISKLATTNSLKNITSWGDVVETGMGIKASIRQCLKPKIKEVRQKCKELKDKEDLELIGMTEEDIEAELEKIITPEVQVFEEKYKQLEDKSHESDVDKTRQKLDEILK